MGEQRRDRQLCGYVLSLMSLLSLRAQHTEIANKLAEVSE